MNKLDRDFLPCLKLRDIAFILSVLTLRTNGCNNSQQCCVRLLGAESFNGLKLCARTPNNTQQHATGCANDAACTIQQFWELLANNAKIASIVTNFFKANLCICILGVNSSNGGIANPKCGDGYSVPQNQGASFFCRPSLYGRYVTIRRHDERTIALNFCEVEVYSARRGTEPSGISVMHFALVFHIG